MSSKIITVTGELGSGKSTVSRLLTDVRGAKRYSTGDAQRQIAQARGISTLEMNLLAETDPSIDQEIDSVFAGLSAQGIPYIVDSRMAWHFIPDSIKVKLAVAPEEAARRVHTDAARVSESARTIDETFAKLVSRRESERRRFHHYYNVDIEDDRNFDFVIDTTAVEPEEVAKLINNLVEGNVLAHQDDRKFWISPKNIFPGEHVRKLTYGDAEGVRKSIQEKGFNCMKPINVVKQGRDYFIADGHRRASGAIAAGVPFVPIIPVKGEAEMNLSWIYDWEDAHDFRFCHYPK